MISMRDLKAWEEQQRLEQEQAERRPPTMPGYEEAAGYILKEIDRAGLKSARRIQRLVAHLAHLTNVYAENERDQTELWPNRYPPDRCPGCAKPVYVAVYLSHDKIWACSDPECEYA